jgi:glycosyltransferase involved in cell wall biosynthesis
MRILNVTQSYSPFYEFGGPPVKVRALSEALVRRGHHVTVLTADWGLQARTPDETEEVRARSVFGWRREENKVEAIYLPNWASYRALSWNPGIGNFCRARLWNFDVVHIFGLYDLLGPRVAAACRAAGIPYVVEPIGMVVPIVRNFQLKRMYHGILGRPMLNGARFLIATSPQEAADFVSTGTARERVVVRRNGVEVPARVPERGAFRAKLGLDGDAKLILFLGRLSEKKSPDLLLEAFARACKSLPHAALQLAFAGPDEMGMKTRLARLATELGIASQVQFCGAIFGEDKWSAYRDADVFVLPSQNENFGNTAAEAAGAGTPVIVTDKCGIAPLLEGAGLVVAHDAMAMARAIERILVEPGLQKRLAVAARDIASRLDWEEPASKMEELYSLMTLSSPQTAPIEN